MYPSCMMPHKITVGRCSETLYVIIVLLGTRLVSFPFQITRHILPVPFFCPFGTATPQIFFLGRFSRRKNRHTLIFTWLIHLV